MTDSNRAGSSSHERPPSFERQRRTVLVTECLPGPFWKPHRIVPERNGQSDVKYAMRPSGGCWVASKMTPWDSSFSML